jgi:hypothetical protein
LETTFQEDEEPTRDEWLAVDCDFDISWEVKKITGPMKYQLKI